MSSKVRETSTMVTMPVVSFQYRPLANGSAAASPAPCSEDLELTKLQQREEELQQRLSAEWAAGYAAAETKLRHEYEARSTHEVAKISEALSSFELTRKSYFAGVEAEVVQLALAIAGKILHREAQVDPMLITAIVQMALGQLKEGSSATIRVRPEDVVRYRAHFDSVALQLTTTILEDAELEPGDCLLETELGSVNFSLNAQLKEVERGFFDVLAQKPQA